MDKFNLFKGSYNNLEGRPYKMAFACTVWGGVFWVKVVIDGVGIGISVNQMGKKNLEWTISSDYDYQLIKGDLPKTIEKSIFPDLTILAGNLYCRHSFRYRHTDRVYKILKTLFYLMGKQDIFDDVRNISGYDLSGDGGNGFESTTRYYKREEDTDDTYYKVFLIDRGGLYRVSANPTSLIIKDVTQRSDCREMNGKFVPINGRTRTAKALDAITKHCAEKKIVENSNMVAMNIPGMMGAWSCLNYGKIKVQPEVHKIRVSLSNNI